MPYKLINVDQKPMGIGDTVFNSLLGSCVIKGIEPPRPAERPGGFGFAGRISVENGKEESELFYPSEVGLVFIEAP